NPNPPHPLALLLRARREGPRGSRAAEQRDELPPFHCPMPPVLPTERIAHLSYGRRLLRCGISGRIRCSGLGHGTEGDRIARGLDRWNAVLPDMTGGAGHYVERAWLRVEPETFPLVGDLAAETEFAGPGRGEPESLIEVFLAPVPADAGADIIPRAGRMLDAARRQGGEAFTPPGQRHQPSRQLLGRFQPLMREVVARAEKHHAPLAFVDAELERRQGKGADMADERCFFLRADEVRLVVQTVGPRAFIGKHA